jgi:hypothetical protein
LRSALTRALNPGVRARAIAVAGAIRSDGTTVAAVEVERLGRR